MTNKKQNTAKINEKLLARVKKLIKMEGKDVKYANTKQFINVAVLKLLEEEEVKRNNG